MGRDTAVIPLNSTATSHTDSHRDKSIKLNESISIFQSKDETEEVVKVRRRVWPIC
jgi:Golgi nucleoside diphosphatase